MGKQVNINKILILLIFVFIFSNCCRKYEYVEFIIKPSFEECDTYNLIWKVDSVIKGENVSNEMFFYLLNSKLTYKFDENIRYKVIGITCLEQIKEHYTDCGRVYILNDSIIDIQR